MPAKNSPRKQHPSAAALDRRRKLAGVRAREDRPRAPTPSLEGDVRARVARADDEHRPVLQLREVAVVARVELGDAGVELAGEVGRRRASGRRPSRRRRCRPRTAGRRRSPRSGRPPSSARRPAVPLRTGSSNRARVRLEVVGHLVLRRVRGRAAPGSASPAGRRGARASRAAASPSAPASCRRAARRRRGSRTTGPASAGGSRPRAPPGRLRSRPCRTAAALPSSCLLSLFDEATVGRRRPAAHRRDRPTCVRRPVVISDHRSGVRRGRARRRRRLPPRARRGGACGRCSARGGRPCAR